MSGGCHAVKHVCKWYLDCLHNNRPRKNGRMHAFATKHKSSEHLSSQISLDFKEFGVLHPFFARYSRNVDMNISAEPGEKIRREPQPNYEIIIICRVLYVCETGRLAEYSMSCLHVCANAAPRLLPKQSNRAFI